MTRNISFKPGSDNMPGYVASTRRITHYGGYGGLRAAWNSLDLFTADDAEDFLAEKLQSISDEDPVKERALQIILGFGLLAVEADREERAHLAEIEERKPPPDPERPRKEGISW